MVRLCTEILSTGSQCPRLLSEVGPGAAPTPIPISAKETPILEKSLPESST